MQTLMQYASSSQMLMQCKKYASSSPPFGINKAKNFELYTKSEHTIFLKGNC